MHHEALARALAEQARQQRRRACDRADRPPAREDDDGEREGDQEGEVADPRLDERDRRLAAAQRDERADVVVGGAPRLDGTRETLARRATSEAATKRRAMTRAFAAASDTAWCSSTRNRLCIDRPLPVSA